jgi:hypothetical protein
MPVELVRPQLVLPDRGTLPSNPGWVMVLNAVPYGETAWIFDTNLAPRAVLTDAEVIGAHVNRQNGTGGWKIYFGTPTRLGEIEPATWTETIHNSGLTGVDPDTGWQFCGFGSNEVAVGGHGIECKLRAADAGTFGTMITNAEPEPPGHTASGNWPPKAKFCAAWGDVVVLANMTDVGPADAFGNTCGFLWWVTADDSGGGANVLGTVDTHPGVQTTFGYLVDDHGDITATAGGENFGALFKATATYRSEYRAGDLIVDIHNTGGHLGTIWPNSVLVVGDEIFFMSLAGPAVLGRTGAPVLLGEGQILRTLFDDDTWVTDGFTISITDVPHLCWATYHPTQDIVTWYYRVTSDEMEMAIHFHRRTGRFSFSQRSNILTPTATTQAGRLRATLVSPRSHLARFSAQQGGVYFDLLGNVWEAVIDGTYKWQHQPQFLTPYLGVARDENGHLLKYGPQAIMPYWELIAGANSRPDMQVTVLQKAELGSNELVAIEVADVMDSDGRIKFSALVETPWALYTILLGDASVTDLDKVASFDGFDLYYDPGGRV